MGFAHLFVEKLRFSIDAERPFAALPLFLTLEKHGGSAAK